MNQSGLTLLGSKADEAQFWQTAITELLFFAIVSFVAVAHDGISMLNTADLRISTDALELMAPMSDHSALLIEDLDLFSISRKAWFEPVRAGVAFRHVKYFDSFYVDLEDPFFLDLMHEAVDQLGRQTCAWT